MRQKATLAFACIAVAGLVGCGETYTADSSRDISSQEAVTDQWGARAQNPMDEPGGWQNAQPAAAQLEGQITTEQFVKQAGSSGLYEVQSSQVALTKSSDEKTRTFAQQMIDDHRKANDELKQIAERKGLAVPTSLESKHQEMLTLIQSQTGEQFTKTYHDQQLKAHQEAVKLFEQASQQLTDEELKAFAKKTLPTLQKHLKACEQFH